MRRLAWIAAALLIALGSVGVLAQTTTPTVTNPEIELQEVEAGSRRYTVDPYDLFNCFIIERTIALPESEDAEALDMTIKVQCFQRVGEEMVALEEVETRDFGVSTSVAVGQAIISEPQVPAEEGDPGDG